MSIRNLLPYFSPKVEKVITVGILPSPASLGYGNDSSFGSITSRAFRGTTIQAAFSRPSSWDFRLVFDDDTLSDDFFYKVIVEDGDNTNRAYLASDATTDTGSGDKWWTWGDGSDPVFAAADAGEAHELIIE